MKKLLRMTVPMLAAAGIRMTRVYGGFEGEDYALESVRMIAVARVT